MPHLTPAQGKAKYVPCLDGIRAVSILLVLMAHTAPLGPKAWLMNAAAGRMGMALFFCLSGYLITSMLFHKPEVLPFLVKRIMRIVPALFLFLAVLFVFFDLPLSSFLLNITFLSNYLTDGLSGGPVGHLWSLCVEVHFYLAISLLVLIFGRRAVWLVFPAALIVTGLRIDAGVISNINTHLRVDEILSGGWLALISIHWADQLRKLLSNRFATSVILILLCILFVVSSHDNGQPLTYLRPYIAMTLIGVVMHSPLRGLLSVLESRIARYIASISYALYIWHMLMIYGWMNTGSTAERYLVKRPISWLLTWFAAHMSTFHWESHGQRLARKWLAGREPK